MGEPPESQHQRRCCADSASPLKVHIAIWPVACVRASQPPDCNWLQPGELARWQSLGSERRREVFLAGRWLAREVLREVCGQALELDILANGAPVVSVGGPTSKSNCLPCVSISHSGAWVAVAVASGPVGLDIEALGRPRNIAALSQYLWPNSYESVEQMDIFWRRWTLSEAWFKACGQGLDLAAMRALTFTAVSRGELAYLALPTLHIAACTPGWTCQPQLSGASLSGFGKGWQAFRSDRH